jgi:hypothetical protein
MHDCYDPVLPVVVLPLRVPFVDFRIGEKAMAGLALESGVVAMHG